MVYFQTLAGKGGHGSGVLEVTARRPGIKPPSAWKSCMLCRVTDVAIENKKGSAQGSSVEKRANSLRNQMVFTTTV